MAPRNTGQPKFVGLSPAVGCRTSSSSKRVNPTSAIQTSSVPGRTVNRYGFRSPVATIRRALGSTAEANGLSGSASPVRRSTRMIVPDRPTGSSPRAQVLAAQGATLGRRWPYLLADPAWRVRTGVRRGSELPVVRVPIQGHRHLLPRAALPIGRTRCCRSCGSGLDAPVVDQDLGRAGRHLRRGSILTRTRRPLAGHCPDSVHGSSSVPVPYSGACPPSIASRV